MRAKCSKPSVDLEIITRTYRKCMQMLRKPNGYGKLYKWSFHQNRVKFRASGRPKLYEEYYFRLSAYARAPLQRRNYSSILPCILLYTRMCVFVRWIYMVKRPLALNKHSSTHVIPNNTQTHTHIRPSALTFKFDCECEIIPCRELKCWGEID